MKPHLITGRGRTLLAASVLLAGVTAFTGCRRNADDPGVGTSSVGAGGANGSASNNNQQAEPVQRTDQDDARRRAQGTDNSTPAAGSSDSDPQKKPGGPAESGAR
jgi:hypothetical protein